MAYNAKVGSFNIDSSVTAGNTQSVTGVGFQPKIVLFWWSGSTASSDSVAGGTISCGFGAAISSSSRFCAAFVSEDGQGTTDTYRYQSAAECIRIYSDTGTLDGLADFSSLDADGFTLTIDDQFGSDWRISYLALGGSDLTNVYIGNDEMPAATGEYDVTGVGFQPEAVIIAGVYGGIPSGSDGANISIGMATGSSNQGVAAINSDDNEATSDTHRYGYNGECYAFPSQYGVGHRQAFVSFGADGFTLNRLEGTSGSIKFSFICLAGGQYEVGDLTTRTDGNDIEENLAGSFEPVAVLFASANMALSTQDSVSSHARLSIGAASATDERAVQAISDEDNLATTETAYTNQDDAVYAHVVDDAIEALMDIKSFDADGFTAVMDTPEATSACWVTYLAIGAAAGGGVDVSLDTLALTGAAQGMTVSPGAVNVALDALGLTAAAQSLTVQAVTTIALDALALVGAAQGLTVAPGEATTALDLLTLTGAAQGLTVSSGAVAVALDALGLTATAQGLTVSPGAVSVVLDALGLSASAETITIASGVIVALNALALSMQAQSLGVSPGAVAVELASLGLTGAAQGLDILPGAVTIALDALTLASAAGPLTVSTGIRVALDALALTGTVLGTTVEPGSVGVSLDALNLTAAILALSIAAGADMIDVDVSDALVWGAAVADALLYHVESADALLYHVEVSDTSRE